MISRGGDVQTVAKPGSEICSSSQIFRRRSRVHGHVTPGPSAANSRKDVLARIESRPWRMFRLPRDCALRHLVKIVPIARFGFPWRDQCPGRSRLRVSLVPLRYNPRLRRWRKRPRAFWSRRARIFVWSSPKSSCCPRVTTPSVQARARLGPRPFDVEIGCKTSRSRLIRLKSTSPRR